MADTKITSLTALGAAPASTDVFPIVDVSDTTQAATGTTKKATMANVAAGVAATANTFTATQTFSAIRSGSLTIADDAATTITPAATGMLFLYGVSDPNTWAMVNYRASTSPSIGGSVGSNVATTTGILSGTTGTDTKLTISPHSTGDIYIENRRGGNATFVYFLIG